MQKLNIIKKVWIIVLALAACDTTKRPDSVRYLFCAMSDHTRIDKKNLTHEDVELFLKSHINRDAEDMLVISGSFLGGDLNIENTREISDGNYSYSFRSHTGEMVKVYDNFGENILSLKFGSEPIRKCVRVNLATY